MLELQTPVNGRSDLVSIYFRPHVQISKLAPEHVAALGADGLIELYSAGGQVKWLDWALQLQSTMDRLFLDEDTGVPGCSSVHEHVGLVHG
jgi:uncharacterized protein YyaL (SSP411 family)